MKSEIFLGKKLHSVGNNVSGEDLNSPEGITSGNGKANKNVSNHDKIFGYDTSVKGKVVTWADVVREN